MTLPRNEQGSCAGGTGASGARPLNLTFPPISEQSSKRSGDSRTFSPRLQSARPDDHRVLLRRGSGGKSIEAFHIFKENF